jgi:hypothetical protein
VSFPDRVRNAQTVLRARAGYKGAIDGQAGKQSLAAAWRAVEAVSDTARAWPADRIVVAAAQTILAVEGFDPGPADGLWGTRTDGAYLEWRAKGLGVPFVDRSAEDTFGRQADMARVFGEAGGPQCTAGRVTVPWGMVLAWDASERITSFSCHEKVAPSAQRAIDRIAAAYSAPALRDLGLHQFGGCFNYRKMRGGTQLSTHAYGIAIDFDPARNRLQWGRDRARLAQRDATLFWAAWEAEGWTSLGRAKNYDWMHVQAAGL